jgi:hypothetical protein
MNTSRLIGQLHVLWRTERIIAELRLRRLIGSIGLQALALFVLGIALLLFEFAGYLMLAEIWGAVASAALIGLLNLVIAGVLMLLALRRPASQELAFASDVQRDAMTALQAELRSTETNAPATLRAAVESAAIPLLLPLIPLVLSRLRGQHKAEKDKTDTY